MDALDEIDCNIAGIVVVEYLLRLFFLLLGLLHAFLAEL